MLWRFEIQHSPRFPHERLFPNRSLSPTAGLCRPSTSERLPTWYGLEPNCASSAAAAVPPKPWMDTKRRSWAALRQSRTSFGGSDASDAVARKLA